MVFKNLKHNNLCCQPVCVLLSLYFTSHVVDISETLLSAADQGAAPAGQDLL